MSPEPAAPGNRLSRRESLLLAAILAALAAVAAPRFSVVTAAARESAVDISLDRLRSAIERYRADHEGRFPGVAPSSGMACDIGVAGSGAAGTAQAVIDQLTGHSDARGRTCTRATTLARFGPYLGKGIPPDPITGSRALVAGHAAAASAGDGGWRYEPATGRIVMNSAARDSAGRTYSAR